MGDRIAQLILEKIDTPIVEEVQGLDQTVHGSGGFGTTGVKSTANDTGSGSVEKKNEIGQKERTVEKAIDTVQAVQDQDQISVPVSSSISAVDQCKLSVYRSSIEIDNSLRVKINSLLNNEILYRDILDEMESNERNEIKRGQEKFKVQKNLLLIHIAGQPEDLQY